MSPSQKNFLSQQNLQMIEELRQQYFTFLIDAGFVQISDSEKHELFSTRHGKSRTRFVRVPAELDTHSKDPKAVMACLAAAMYPKLLVIDKSSGQMRTLANSATAAIHPSSVNFTPGKRVDFGDAKFVAFFTAMHTKKLCELPRVGIDKLVSSTDIVLTSGRYLGEWNSRRAGDLSVMWTC